MPFRRDVNPALVPPFEWQAGINPTGTGNCDGAVNGTNEQPILIPCTCPPNSTVFLAALNRNVAAGFVTTNPNITISFPTDNSTASQNTRLHAASVTLLNLNGPGEGCPIQATTYAAQQQAINDEVISSSTYSSASSTTASITSTTLSFSFPSATPSINGTAPTSHSSNCVTCVIGSAYAECCMVYEIVTIHTLAVRQRKGANGSKELQIERRIP
ncbi:hypothetical protein SERLA73DRAFT_77785 [Serpula lacrymans var. lacrymans S7.3]|uniref:Uncharacterized protein n=2 Tax=Serpula lacrymans var. lacrymans TaxID=341189 RepID=F8QAZ3_SERL3|nr:uncharacterized protein SERLADRAFT_442685 [Serpula lacrymans var. lacrymans S7.9]EGN94379.1 hypothetical protein SERLA73DRAFT_77785 [Serpula lacrymans var. lacrymans S7.3]EGO19862.1 hypothetical protein SERLADRAFT_442685 [Serpula lacrymans var. lacrymans S7.9]